MPKHCSLLPPRFPSPSVLQPLISTLSHKPSVAASLLSSVQSRFAISLLAIRLLFHRVLSHILPSLCLSRFILFPVSPNDFTFITYLTIFILVSSCSISISLVYLSAVLRLSCSVSFCCRPPTFFKPVSLAFHLCSLILLRVRSVAAPRHLAIFSSASLLVPSSSPAPHLLFPCLASPQSPSPKSCSVTFAALISPVQPKSHFCSCSVASPVISPTSLVVCLPTKVRHPSSFAPSLDPFRALPHLFCPACIAEFRYLTLSPCELRCHLSCPTSPLLVQVSHLPDLSDSYPITCILSTSHFSCHLRLDSIQSPHHSIL